MTTAYAELQCTSHFSFLRGASSCDELFNKAKALGISALGIVDRNSLAGVVRAYQAANATGVRLIVGCHLDLKCGTSILVYPTDRAAYGRLCRLLSEGKKRAGKGECELQWSDVETWCEGMVGILIPDEADDICVSNLRKLKAAFGDDAYLALTLRRRPNDARRLTRLANLAASARVPTVATNDILFHEPDRQILQDVVTCIRHGCTIDEAGFRRERHADRYLKPPEEMARLFKRHPEAVRRTLDVVGRCRFSMAELVYQYPEEKTMPGMTAQDALRQLTWEGAKQRYPQGVPRQVVDILRHELTLIGKLEYAPYFLTVNSIVRFARSQGILCQGRGSAANSAVCYVLGITSIDPSRNDMLFERFVSEERREPPDIDVDFEHERREIVIQWIYETYGRNHSALTAVVTRYRPKSALADVGKVLGLPEDLLRSMSKQIWGWKSDGLQTDQFKDMNLNDTDRRLRLALSLASQLLNTPRHMSQHPGGFVLTQDRLDELVPIEPAAMEDRQIIEWDKDDIDTLRFMKVDVLGLGMLGCMKRAFDLLKEHKEMDLDLATIPAECPQTYKMISRADTLGTFQIESRAQMSMLPRLKPRAFYDLVIQVAIVRPGPIQGDMVHPYLRRREGKEKVVFPTPELERVLGKTLGVPLFQEQAMRVAIECAGFTPGQADMLRRGMATFKETGGISEFHEPMIKGMMERGYDAEFAEKIFSQLQGFGSYGFPESHAYSFALIAYASCWIKRWHPDVFCAALLNAQPMGFYGVAQIVTDARKHGVEVRPICVNTSRWDCTLEPTDRPGKFAVRLGFRMVKGIANAHMAALLAVRSERPFISIEDIWSRAKVPLPALVKLAEADAYLSALGVERRKALFAIKGLGDEPLPLFAAAAAREGGHVPEIHEPVVYLRPMKAGGEVVEDYGSVGLTLRNHPVSFLRYDYVKRGFLTCKAANEANDTRYVQVAGMVMVRQRPGSANGVTFITLEDETGIINAIVWEKTFDLHRSIVMSAKMLLISGQIQREGDVVHLVARSLADLSADLSSIGERDTPFPLPHGRGDEFHHGGSGQDSRVRAKSPPSRDAHSGLLAPTAQIDPRTRNFK
ncbi:error-prone DNA polymerase 1 [Asticcacaulis endophyticus]|uniref:Error-prone DNA polymerase n=1 Tax=Asticcacaulis endophyticus TaxID=1395890 RepID=A0A918Q590_9CAUL|nr:error-prone DNA polymerase [Asticcacaulis endophyticus]GGZ32475.1 error-prone DNA polymerase 1 [Asticcacaulis endophyticus]